ncbi:MAG: rRNA maturation RNase YbeY [Clostridium sp.]|uniref:rRNA maturation RNase YbeY n=1 Tax=Clostridium sp. TaxID=1506 RepID=UPI002FCA7BD8
MIYLDDRQDKIKIDEEFTNKLEEVINFALKEEEVTVSAEISMLFVDNEDIRGINAETRGIDRATDVLSFPMLDYEDKKVFKEMYKDKIFNETFMDGDELVLGDIVLSLERALEQSEEYNHSFTREASYLVVHSVLHLLGYDHMEDEDKKVMREREEEILNKLEIRR